MASKEASITTERTNLLVGKRSTECGGASDSQRQRHLDKGPRNRKYDTLEERMRSLGSVPQHLKENMPSINVLAENGFYYSGVEDTCICYECEGKFNNWQIGDNVFVIHSSKYPKCPLMQKKIGAILKPVPPRKPAVQNERTAMDIVKEHGFSDNLIEEACEELRNADVPITAPSLMERVQVKNEMTEEREEKDRLTDKLKEENDRFKNKLECNVCRVNDKNAIIKLCNHCVCMDCGNRCLADKLGCPLCRQDITAVEMMYL